MPYVYKPKPCRDCGGPKDASLPRSQRSWYCKPCAEKRSIAFCIARFPCGNCRSWGEYYACADCRKAISEKQKAAAAKGAEKRRANKSGYFRPLDAERWWQSRCHSAVQAAIKRGLLPSLKSGEYACTDCGCVAHEYDHRDYARPFDVQPVCRSCNKQRGTALWPTPDRFDFKRVA